MDTILSSTKMGEIINSQQLVVEYDHDAVTGNDVIMTPASTSTDTTDIFSGLKDFSESYSRIHGYAAALVCVWGIAANTANIVVLTRDKMTSSTNLILTWLAVADLLTMVSCLPVNVHFYALRDPRLPFPSTRSRAWIAYFIFNINFTVACHTVAIWLTITLAIFRYLCICYPARGVAMCSRKMAKAAVFAVYGSTAVVCIPNYMVARIAEKPDNTSSYDIIVQDDVKDDVTIISRVTDDANFQPEISGVSPSTYYTVEDTQNEFLVSVNFWIQAFLIKLIPCLLLTMLTILLVAAMHEANLRRMRLKSQGRQDESERARETNRTTAMLLAVVGLFLLTELPQGVLTLCSIFINWFYMDVYLPLGDVLDMAALLNNSINFVLYCTMSRQFRETFVEIFCRCCDESKPVPSWMKLQTVGRTTSAVPALIPHSSPISCNASRMPTPARPPCLSPRPPNVGQDSNAVAVAV